LTNAIGNINKQLHPVIGPFNILKEVITKPNNELENFLFNYSI